MARYRLTGPASQDIADILSFVAASSGQRRATGVAVRLHNAFNRLAAFPLSGKPRPEFAPGLRSAIVQSWIAYYRPSSAGPDIEIIRVLHAARDQAAALES